MSSRRKAAKPKAKAAAVKPEMEAVAALATAPPATSPRATAPGSPVGDQGWLACSDVTCSSTTFPNDKKALRKTLPSTQTSLLKKDDDTGDPYTIQECRQDIELVAAMLESGAFCKHMLANDKPCLHPLVFVEGDAARQAEGQIHKRPRAGGETVRYSSSPPGKSKD